MDDCHDLLRWMIPHLDKFPRNRRFSIGQRLESELLEVLADCVNADYARHKETALEHASQRLAVVQHLWRLAYELRTIPGNREGLSPPTFASVSFAREPGR